MKVIYPVLFYEEENGGYSVFVPDLNNVATDGSNLEEALEMAKDLIAGVVLDTVEEGKKIPPQSNIEDISFKKFEDWLNIDDWKYKSRFKTYIIVDIDEYAKKWGKQLAKKTVNIPQWLNTLAENQNVNFSRTLEDALMEKVFRDE